MKPHEEQALTETHSGEQSDLREARAAARESERRYRELVEHANSVIIRIDPAFRILFVNEYALNFFGCGADDLLDKNLLDVLVPEQDVHGNDQHMISRRAAESPEIHGSYDQQNRCFDGRLVWMHWAVRALRDARGNVRELLCVGIDITRRKEAEFRAEAYQKQARRLANQLIESEENERSSMAVYLHDHIIQNLSLAVIRMGAAIDELSPSEGPMVKQHLTSVRMLIEDAVAECRSIMDQLEPALLKELGLVAALNHLVERQQVPEGTRVGITDGLDGVRLPERLELLLFRCVRELLMNALKYAGADRINISLAKKDHVIVVQVEDDGAGFAPGELEESHYDRDGGFGLFAVRERLESLGGTLDIQSEAGRGTVAVIRVQQLDAGNGAPGA